MNEQNDNTIRPGTCSNDFVAQLNKKQQVFVQHYRATRNATKAAIAAGYSEKTAYAAGPRLLKDVRVQAEIERQDAN